MNFRILSGDKDLIVDSTDIESAIVKALFETPLEGFGMFICIRQENSKQDYFGLTEMYLERAGYRKGKDNLWQDVTTSRRVIIDANNISSGKSGSEVKRAESAPIPPPSQPESTLKTDFTEHSKQEDKQKSLGRRKLRTSSLLKTREDFIPSKPVINVDMSYRTKEDWDKIIEEARQRK